MYWGMKKIRFNQSVTVDLEKPRLDEVWDKTFRRWEEVRAEEIISGEDGWSDVVTYDGDILRNVPSESFEVVG